MSRLALIVWFVACAAPAAEVFRVATYNLNNYLLAPAGARPMKTAEGRAKIRESLRAVGADVVALQEVGGLGALQELRAALRAEGVDYPFWEHITARDTNIQVAVLSRFPITARRPHTNDSYLLFGRRLRVSRGFAEVEIQVAPRYSFTLITCHLKSRRPVPEADEAEMREQEALILREKIDRRLRADPDANLIVLGDLNDVKDSRAVRSILGRGRTALLDTRPAERNGDQAPAASPRHDPPRVTWTHYYGEEDTYSRSDYLLLSADMSREWRRDETYVLALPDWGVGSDHRPLVAAFVAEDR
ncbi:MAG TPA: endonuclease/exonuclease/phosphatase family protein [Methylomirabilota bacterium]|nr:endonuclease/exonuclease/phosphatase family protein [Methylomirabilota bacterium]